MYMSYFSISRKGPKNLGFHRVVAVCPVQAKLRAAAKMRISRMVKPKTKRTDLNVDDWVKKEWATGNKNMLADLLSKANFNKDGVAVDRKI